MALRHSGARSIQPKKQCPLDFPLNELIVAIRGDRHQMSIPSGTIAKYLGAVMTVKFSDLDLIIKRAKETQKTLKASYPGLLAYPVFSSRFGQSNLKNGIDLFIEFPEMFETTELVEQIQNFVKSKKKVEKQLKARLEELEKRMRDLKGKHFPGEDKEFKDLREMSKEFESQINNLLTGLVIKDDVFVELRFDQLNFEIIEQLKQDPNVSQEYTDQASRSIRIVLFLVNQQT